MTSPMDFPNLFYNIAGVHYNERKKNFYKLLESKDPHHLTEQLNKIQPRNYLEKLFYVDILIYAKKTEKLMEILIQGNGVFPSKVLKQKWFFGEAFGNPEDIVTKILPMFSHSIRMKVLKRLALSSSEEKMDKVFDLLLERYGMFTAQQFIFACSTQKFTEILTNNEITLSVEQLKRILDRDSNRVKTYLEYKKTFHDPDFVKYILWKYPQLFSQFKSYLNEGVRLGRRTTKSILKIHKDEALNDVNIEKLYNISVITRKVKGFQEKCVMKYFPEKLNELNHYSYGSNVFNILKCCPVKKRWHVLSTSFKIIYNDEIENHLKQLTLDFIRMAPSNTIQKWAEFKFQATNEMEYVMHFTNTKKVLKLVRERINVTSDFSGRKPMLKDLILFYQKSEDYATYEELLKYISIRHRNEDKPLRDEVMNQLTLTIDYNRTSETFWGYVNTLIDVYRIKNEPLPWENMCQFLIFLYKKNLPMTNAMEQYLKDVLDTDSKLNLIYFNTEPKVKADIMQQFPKYIVAIKKPSKSKSLLADLLEEMVEFNKYKENKDFWIDFNHCPEIVTFIRDCVRKKSLYDDRDSRCIFSFMKNNYGANARTKVKVCCSDVKLFNIVKTLCSKFPINMERLMYIFIDMIKKPRTQFQNDLFHYYISQHYIYQFFYLEWNNIIKYLVTCEPEFIVKYGNKLLSVEVLSATSFDYSIIKFYNHLLLDKLIIDHFTPLVSPESTCESKRRLLDNLSKFMTTETYIHLISKYLPKVNKLECMNAEQKGLYEIQCGIVKSLRNTDDLVKVISILYQFCQGDYVQASIPLLYKILYRIGEHQACQVVSVLVDKAVSVRKHALYFAFETLPQNTSIELFNMLASTEKNISTKKYLFRALLKYFLKSPSDTLFDLVVKNMIFVDKNDKELLEAMSESFKQVAGKYKGSFAEHLWQLFDNMEKKEISMHRYRSKLLKSMNSHGPSFINSLNDAFCQDIIKRYFLSDNDTLMKNGEIFVFVANYLLAYTADQQFKFVFELVINYKKLFWEVNGDNNRNFVLFLENTLKDYTHRDSTFFSMFKTYWEQTFSHIESFNEYVLIEMVLLYKTSLNIAEFASQLNRIFHQLLLEYGPFIKDFLLKSISEFLLDEGFYDCKIFTANNLALELLKNDQDDLSSFLACNLTNKNQKKIYLQVVDRFKHMENTISKLYYYEVLRK